MDIETRRARRSEIDCERIVLTHMGNTIVPSQPLNRPQGILDLRA